VRCGVGFKEKDNRVVPGMGALVFVPGRILPAAGGGAPPPSPGFIIPTYAVRHGRRRRVPTYDQTVERGARAARRASPRARCAFRLSAGDRLAVGDFSQLNDGRECSGRALSPRGHRGSNGTAE